MLDILIRNGEVIDGSGAALLKADVAILNGRIVQVGELAGADAARVIDASGHVVSPGFVDMHTHADFTLPVGPTADSMVTQGITTAATGQCGTSPAPILPGRSPRELLAALWAMLSFEGMPWGEWRSFGDYLDYLERLGTSINVVPLVGHGMIRANVMGYDPSPASPQQMAQMQRELLDAMDGGAVGVSTGLIYAPGMFTSTEELIEFTRPCGERGGFYFSHIRNENDTLLESLAEAIRIGRETGASVQISHFKAGGKANWGKVPAALEMIDQARAEGLDVSADMYPYLAGSTGLSTLLPKWAQHGGNAAILARLADDAQRREMAAEMTASDEIEWDKVLLSRAPEWPQIEGRHVADLADEAGRPAYDWVFDALLRTKLDIEMVRFNMSEENKVQSLRHPQMMIGCDGMGLCTQGLLSAGIRHPRNYGTFPRVLSHYVREEGVITLEEAVHKMTGLAATKLRWHDRGLLREGYAADVVVFDPATVRDLATYERPHQYATGIPYVIVNGKMVIENGAHTQVKPGRVLRRKH